MGAQRILHLRITLPRAMAISGKVPRIIHLTIGLITLHTPHPILHMHLTVLMRFLILIRAIDATGLIAMRIEDHSITLRLVPLETKGIDTITSAATDTTAKAGITNVSIETVSVL